MSTLNNEQVASDIKTAFEAMKTIFNVGSSSINLKSANEGLVSGGSGGTAQAAKSSEFQPFCINVCGMSDLVDSIRHMKDSLHQLQLSLVTLEYCLVSLTVILGLAIGATVFALAFYALKVLLASRTQSPKVVATSPSTHHPKPLPPVPTLRNKPPAASLHHSDNEEEQT